jgi:RiboL-PSP-HEPN
MPSNAFRQHLLVLLEDADDLLDVHRQRRTGRPGRQWGLGALNRAAVVLCVSAWEAYVEEVIREAITALRPAPGTPLGTWAALHASARSSIGRFNNPNVENVRMLLSDAVGLPDITVFWSWRNCTVVHARELLAEALRFRHQIAHGINPGRSFTASTRVGCPLFSDGWEAGLMRASVISSSTHLELRILGLSELLDNKHRPAPFATP